MIGIGLTGWLTWHTQSVSILCQRASVSVCVVGCPNGGRMLWDRSCFGMADWMESIGCKIIMMMIIFSGFRLAFSPFEHQSKPKVVRRGGGVHLPRQYTLDAQFNLSLFSLYFHHHHHHHDHDCQEQQRQQPTGQSVSHTKTTTTTNRNGVDWWSHKGRDNTNIWLNYDARGRSSI